MAEAIGRYDHHRRGLSWDSGKWPAVALATLIVAALFPTTAPTDFTTVIVRETHPASNDAEGLVAHLGGVVSEHLTLIGGFTATLPVHLIDDLAADPAVVTVTEDTTLRPRWDSASQWESSGRDNSLWLVAKTTGADEFWRAGFRGDGVDVALIDTGVAPVPGLEGQIVNGADLSFESQDPDLRYLDTNGHGTHMAGIIASSVRRDRSRTGMAPEARIVNVKVAGADGAVDVSQVIAAIDWVVQHKNDNGLDIRVLNLSYGTDSSQDPQLDPLSYAVEQAWAAGIVVVVAGGNEGADAPLNDPATNPYVIAVGATDTRGTMRSRDDRIAHFSSCGTDRTVDLVAPGTSIRSLRVPGSVADTQHPDARVGRSLFKGTGTSQATAVVSGAAALIVDQRPDVTPDQVKALLIESAARVRGASAGCQGAGQVDLDAALHLAMPTVTQAHTAAGGLGSLDAARGSSRVSMNDVALEGEQDIHGRPWDAAAWAIAAASGTSWTGGTWNGTSWTGADWLSGSWSGTSWTGASWSGTSWSGTSWSANTWTGTSWTSGSWSSGSWSGVAWTGIGWN